MMNTEKKNRMTSMYVALGSHVVLVLMFFLMVAWSEPDPPIPEYGIEFNLGEQFISNTKEESEPVKAEEISTEEELEEVQEETVENTEEQSEVSEEFQEPIEEVVETPVEEVSEVVETEDIYSPDVVEKKEVKEIEEVKEEEQKEVVKVETGQPKTETSDTEAEQAAEPKIDNRAIYKKSESGSGTGNKGASLDLSGWMWDSKPSPNDQSDQNGYIIFEIKVDSEGEIVGVKTLEKTVSPVVEQVYKESVRGLTFSRVSDNSSSASISTGKITFIIQSK